MENTLIEFDEKLSELKEIVDQLRDYIGDSPISKKLRDGFKSFYKNIEAYSVASESEDIEKIASSANFVAVYGQLIGQGMAQFQEADNQMKTLGSELLEKSNAFRNVAENSPLEYEMAETAELKDSSPSITSYKSVKRSLQRLSENHLEHDRRIKKLLNENESGVDELNSRLTKLEHYTKATIDKVSSLYEESLIEVDSKKQQIDEILGHVSGRAIAGDFETNAAEEKGMANWLRYASLLCMAFIVAIVGYSFWETTTADFQWQNSLFRIALAIILSVPATYLARESAKHREQQYSHLQTSLDLKAITPYIASLPIEDQHKLKIEVAGRLFAAKEKAKFGVDPYSINAQEIVIELIRSLKLNNRRADDKDG
jgi:hypothetical protein